MTATIYVPQIFTNPQQTSALGLMANLVWVIVLFTAAPVTAWMLARHRTGSVLTSGVLPSVAVGQLVRAVVSVQLDTWLEVRSGYLLAGSGEEAMSYGLGLVLSVLGGAVLAALTDAGARLGGSTVEPPREVSAGGRR